MQTYFKTVDTFFPILYLYKLLLLFLRFISLSPMLKSYFFWYERWIKNQFSFCNSLSLFFVAKLFNEGSNLRFSSLTNKKFFSIGNNNLTRFHTGQTSLEKYSRLARSSSAQIIIIWLHISQANTFSAPLAKTILVRILAAFLSFLGALRPILEQMSSASMPCSIHWMYCSAIESQSERYGYGDGKLLQSSSKNSSMILDSIV